MDLSKNIFISLFYIFTLLWSEASSRPNVILICVDDMNTNISALGGTALTPNIDRLAAEGVLFTDAHCNVPVCNASRASFMTGMHADTLKVYANHPNFRTTAKGKDAETIPQYFAKFGYKTAAVGKIFHNGRGNKKKPRVLSDDQSWHYQFPNDHGVPYAMPESDKDLWHKGRLSTKNYWPGRIFIWDSVDIPDEETYDWQNADFCAKFLENDHDKPFFLACGIFKPHAPFIAPKKYFDLYPLESIKRPEILENDLDDIGAIGVKWAHRADLHKWITHFGEWEKAIQAYLASTSYADACIGHLLDALDQSVYRDNTIVVLLSDHGFHLGEKEHWAKFTFWDIGTRVPFIIKSPGGSTASFHGPTSLIDLYPTLVDLAGLPPKEDLEGSSLRPQLMDPSKTHDRPVHILFEGPGNEAIVTQDWRYIRYEDGSEELYDRNKDPKDWYNLTKYSVHEETINRLRKNMR